MATCGNIAKNERKLPAKAVRVPSSEISSNPSINSKTCPDLSFWLTWRMNADVCSLSMQAFLLRSLSNSRIGFRARSCKSRQRNSKGK